MADSTTNALEVIKDDSKAIVATQNHKVGRPTDYRPEYCEDIIKFFSRPLTKTVYKTYTTKAGTVIKEPIEKPNELPTIEEYCSSIGIVVSTLHEWRKHHPEFSKAYTHAKQLEKDFLVKNGLCDRYNARFAQFVAINCTDMVDKIEVSGSGATNIAIQIVRPEQVNMGIKVELDDDDIR